SMVLGPPSIHKRMQERRRCGSVAVSAASRPSQPESEKPLTPAAESLSQSRRDRRGLKERLKETPLGGGGDQSGTPGPRAAPRGPSLLMLPPRGAARGLGGQ